MLSACFLHAAPMFVIWWLHVTVWWLFIQLLISGTHILSLSFYIITIILLCYYSLFIWLSTLFSFLCLCRVAVSYIPLIVDEARTTEVQEGSSSFIMYYLLSYCYSKNRCKNRPSTTTPCISCIYCAKCFARVLEHICQYPNTHQNCIRCQQLGYACITICSILSICFLSATNLLIAPKKVHF